MQTEQNAKQQIVERIKNSTNILVTVGNNPSVDALSAALSLTLMLNRLDKHVTAVFSGQVPPAIDFLEPNKTFEGSVDSLRDFIIALDKEKADRLRYKVEDDVVRIFITPYKTILSEKDLQFSQGDFNVETIIALGVEKEGDLDTAITAHGRILHDATVMTINADGGSSSLGSVDWSDSSASSLCEMLMSLSEALQSGLLDKQVSTALLTGIVANTDRFRNERTSPKVMTMAAQLMAAGANQQLIAAKLEEGHGFEATPTVTAKDGSQPMSEGKSQKVGADGALAIDHAPVADSRPLPDPGAEALKEAENELAQSLAATQSAVAPVITESDLNEETPLDTPSEGEPATEPAVAEQAPAQADSPQIIKQEHRSWRTDPAAEPAFGGTLNATTEQAADAARAEEEDSTNRQILSHDAPESSATQDSPASEPAPTPAPEPEPALPVMEEPPMTPPAEPEAHPVEAALQYEAAPIVPSGPTLDELDNHTRGKAADEARAAIDAALGAMPLESGTISALDQATAAVSQPSTPAPEVVPLPEPTPESLPPAPVLPPLPDFSTLPPLPANEPVAPPVDPTVPPSAPAPSDPGQFKIPGQ